MGQLWQIWPYLSVGVGAALVGAVLSGFWRPSNRFKSYIQHFAAGLVLAAVAVEILPEIERLHTSGFMPLAGFLLGSGCMAFWKHYTEKLEKKEQGGRPGWGSGATGGVRRNVGLLATAATDTAVDGLVIGAGFATGSETGSLLAIGLSIELLFLALATGTAIRSGSSQVVTVLAAASLAIFLLVGAAGGVVLLSAAPEKYRAGTLAFGAAALLYLVTEELLVEAHKHQETWLATAIMFVGFATFWLIRILH